MTGSVICHDMKVRRSYRLDSLADAVIKRLAGERHCSEAEVIEKAVLGSSGVTGNTVACDAAVAGSSPALPTIQKDEKREMFEALKAKLAGKPQMDGLDPIRLTQKPVDLSNVPHAPFDFEQDCEKFRVRGERSGLGLYWLGEDGEQRKRSLEPGELETFWAKRIIK